MMRQQILALFLFSALVITGCGAAVVGGAAYGGYSSARDERSIGTMVDDSLLSGKVSTRLISDEFVKSRHIDVDVLNGVVFLIGVVESESQKRMAADIARGVDGVRGVENQLHIGKTSAGQVVDDTVLTSKIRTKLIQTSGVKSTNIDIDTNNNVVTMTGIVESYEEKNKVLHITRKVVGNRKIIDNLSVK